MCRLNGSLILLRLVALFQCYQLGQTQKVDCSDAADQKCGLSAILYGSIAENYDKIDNHLVKRQENLKDVDKIMEEAIRWLNKQKSKNLVLRNNNLIKALEQFTALIKTVGKDSCNREGYNILLLNHEATENRAYVPEHDLAKTEVRSNPFGRRSYHVRIEPRLIDRIVQAYSLRHANVCQQVYQDMFEARYKELDQTILHRARTFVDILAKPHVLKFRYGREEVELNLVSLDDMKMDEITVTLNGVKDLFEDPSLGRVLDAEVAYNGAKLIAEKDPSLSNTLDERGGRIWIRPEKVGQVLKSYLLNPCQYYVAQFGPDLFELAEYDEKVIPGNRVYNEATVRYYFRYMRYRVCKTLIKEEESFVDKVISVAASKQAVIGRE